MKTSIMQIMMMFEDHSRCFVSEPQTFQEAWVKTKRNLRNINGECFAAYVKMLPKNEGGGAEDGGRKQQLNGFFPTLSI